MPQNRKRKWEATKTEERESVQKFVLAIGWVAASIRVAIAVTVVKIGLCSEVLMATLVGWIAGSSTALSRIDRLTVGWFRRHVVVFGLAVIAKLATTFRLSRRIIPSTRATGYRLTHIFANG
jgi:hypothetical protein